MMDLREIGQSGKGSIELVQERDQWSVLVNTAMNI
jgi:hypothetical protein